MFPQQEKLLLKIECISPIPLCIYEYNVFIVYILLYQILQYSEDKTLLSLLELISLQIILLFWHTLLIEG